MATQGSIGTAEGIGQSLARDFGAFMIAPYTTLGLVLIVGFGVWLALHFIYRNRIDGHKEEVERLRSRVSEYQQKAGDTPDEARARLEALEAKIVELSPRRLTSEQAETIRQVASRAAGTLSLKYVNGAPDGAGYLFDLSRAFEAAGWSVAGGALVAGVASDVGVAVRVNQPGAAADAAVEALEMAAVAFEIADEEYTKSIADVSILICLKVESL